MPASGISLVDANVWLALAVDVHAHHRMAKAWFESRKDDSWAFCRVPQMALLRHLTNRHIMGEANVLGQKGAWEVYDSLVNDPRVVFVTEMTAIDAPFRAAASSESPRHQRWTDAYLAAFAKAHGFSLTTLDRGFLDYGDLKVDLLI